VTVGHPRERQSAAYDPLDTRAGGTSVRPPAPFNSATPLAEPDPGTARIFERYREDLKQHPLRTVLFWAGEFLGAVSLFVGLFGGLLLAEIFR